MVQRPLLPILCLTLLLASGATVQAQAPMPPPPSAFDNSPAAAPKPQPKPRKPKARAESDPAKAQAAPRARPAGQAARETPSGNRRMMPDDIEDGLVPRSSPGGGSVAPMMTPTGRAGLGGRF